MEQVPAVEIETWQLEGGKVNTDYAVGEGLTRVVIGIYGSQKASIELIIGGTPINESLSAVLSLDDVRQLRDNLSTLLTNLRVQQPEPQVSWLAIQPQQKENSLEALELPSL